MRQQGGRRGGGGGGGEGETREHIHSNTTGNFSPTDNLKMGQKVNRDTRQGQCHEIFDTFFIKKLHLGGPFGTGKNGFAKFFRFRRRFSRKTSVHVDNDYADRVTV